MNVRQWLRFPSEIGTVTVRQEETRRLMADVLDESFAGMGLAMAEAGHLEANDRVRVSYRGLPMDARVRHISPMANGYYRVGMEWVTRPPRLRLYREE
ncbi:PilZ domain-containing protein [bacterium]|nr:PilZ domain-containing protein [bacterium]